VNGADLRRTPRAEIALPCTLRRVKGSPIDVQTVNLGAGGMLVTSVRPLAVDEQVTFELAALQPAVSGQARVLRQQRHDLYALRFEGLPEATAGRLNAFATG